jgi:hypothetical protein
MSIRAGLRLLSIAAVCAIAATTSAWAQAADDEEGPSEVQKLLGAAGLLELPKDPIDYQERSPLVVPPTTTLPPPQNVGDVTKLNPEWPNDTDWRRVNRAAARAKTSNEERRGNFYVYGSNTKVEDMSRVNPARPDKKSNDTYLSAGEEAKAGAERYSPSQLGFLGFGKKASGNFAGEPERTLLTEPPPGYRTPSPNAPYGVVEVKPTNTKTSVFDRLEDPNAKSK